MRILLVDDEVELVTAMAERLSYRGLEADWASTGEDAVAKARETAYDVAVLDLKMPGVSGLDLMRQIAAIRPETKFIILTGHGENGAQECTDAGVRSYLMKPLRIDALVAKIREAAG